MCISFTEKYLDQNLLPDQSRPTDQKTICLAYFVYWGLKHNIVGFTFPIHYKPKNKGRVHNITFSLQNLNPPIKFFHLMHNRPIKSNIPDSI